jgi:hypothetical protein
MRAPWSGGVDLKDRLGKGLRGFLWKVVADAAPDGPVRAGAGELPGVIEGGRAAVEGGVVKIVAGPPSSMELSHLS